ncbi:MAG: hypothetical protein NTU97_01545 [Candidatus Magasanikbacteria bacterium]|nr:hypothetical protein [Candidatus Magasanikbacteria bacterium]
MLELFVSLKEKIKDIWGKGLPPPDQLPEGFVDKQQSLLMLQVLAKVWPKKEIVGPPGRRGLRFKMGPIYLELYVCYEEPILEDFDHFRFVCWQPLTRIDKPAGWHQDWLYMTSQYGVVELKDKNWEDWSNHAKRHRQRWLRDENYEMMETDLETFSAAYQKTNKVGKFLRTSFLKTIKLHLDNHFKDVGLFVARRKDNKSIIGGLAVINYPDVSLSTHAISFITPEGLKTSVGTGVIDYWYEDCKKRGLKFLSFGLVWKPGDPAGWRGYSQFKKQFAITLMYYRYQFVKFVRAKKGIDKK